MPADTAEPVRTDPLAGTSTDQLTASAEAAIAQAEAPQTIKRDEALYLAQVAGLDAIIASLPRGPLKSAVEAGLTLHRRARQIAIAHNEAQAEYRDVRLVGGEQVEEALAREADYEKRWMDAWEDMANQAQVVLDTPVARLSDLAPRVDAYLCLVGDFMDPAPYSSDPDQMEHALKSFRSGLDDLRKAACPVSLAADSLVGALQIYDEMDADNVSIRAAWRNIEGPQFFAESVRAQSLAGLACRLSVLGKLADDIDDKANKPETQDEANRAVECIRDIAANAITLLSLPVDPTITDYYLGDRAMIGLGQ